MVVVTGSEECVKLFHRQAHIDHHDLPQETPRKVSSPMYWDDGLAAVRMGEAVMRASDPGLLKTDLLENLD